MSDTKGNNLILSPITKAVIVASAGGLIYYMYAPNGYNFMRMTKFIRLKQKREERLKKEQKKAEAETSTPAPRPRILTPLFG